MHKKKTGHLLGGTLLVAGTAIGGGMLGLPVLTAACGFLPAATIYLFCWFFMACTGILLMESALHGEKETNLVSMATAAFGLPGRLFAWFCYLFLFYSLSIAYIAGGGRLVGDLLQAFHFSLPPWLGPLLFVALFAPWVALSATAVGRINALLVGGLILSFALFFFAGIAHVDLGFLLHQCWPMASLATPIVFTSFAYQGVVPSLVTYMDRRTPLIKKAIWIGSLIPLIAYLLWEALILGVVPQEALLQARAHGLSAVAPLKDLLDLPLLFPLGEFFAFFAIVTSFLGVTLGLLDFLADGLKVKKTRRGRLGLSCLVFLPPLLFTLFNPTVFLVALKYAGGIGCALLLGLLPILMAWRMRSRFKERPALPGGRPLLLLLLLFLLFELSMMLNDFF